MESMEEQYGIDANFIVEVPDFLKCGVCHLVMRDPIQIMTCGHRFCNACFERVKGYSEYLNTGLCCPVDRQLIDTSKVINDVGMARDINSLQVKCYQHEKGCTWKGDLHSIQEHRGKCPYEEKVSQNQYTVQKTEGDSTLLKELCSRVSKCEDAMTDKEKEIAYLKFNIQELKKQFTEKEKEVELLKVKNNKIEEEMKTLKDRELDVKHQFDIKLENLILRNQLLDNKISSFEHQLVLSKKCLDEQEEHVKCVKVKALNDNTANEKMQELSNNVQQFQSKHDDEMKKLKDDIDIINTQIIEIKKESNEKTGEIKREAEDEINALKSHITNIENTLFCNTVHNTEDIIIHWTLQNYNHHFQLGETVCSPIFFIEVKGYCVRLEVEWSGKKKGNLGLFIKLCKGSYFESYLEPFNMEITLEIHDNKGNKVSGKLHSKDINTNRKKNYTIHPEKKLTAGRGFPTLVTMPILKNYIINDTILV